MHELRHAYQQYYVNKLLDGKLPETDPHYQQAIIFALSDAFYSQVTAPQRKTPGAIYTADPREGDAQRKGGDDWNVFQQSKGIDDKQPIPQ